MSATSYLTEAEVASVQHLHRRTPFVICGVSHGFFSTARYSGGMTLQGEDYTYIPAHDECVRVDVLKIVLKARRAAAREPKPLDTGDLFAAPTTGGAG